MTEETKMILDVQLELIASLEKDMAETRRNLNRIATTICREEGLEVGTIIKYLNEDWRIVSILGATSIKWSAGFYITRIKGEGDEYLLWLNDYLKVEDVKC
jgi:hypothetical protein